MELIPVLIYELVITYVEILDLPSSLCIASSLNGIIFTLCLVIFDFYPSLIMLDNKVFGKTVKNNNKNKNVFLRVRH